VSNLRQSILVRTDLHLSVGLMAAQIAHIHMRMIQRNADLSNNILSINPPATLNRVDLKDWLISPYLFIHQVPHLEALEYFEKKANDMKIHVESWTDTIYQELSPDFRTAFNMKVGISLGPTDSDKIKLVIGSLPLL